MDDRRPPSSYQQVTLDHHSPPTRLNRRSSRDSVQGDAIDDDDSSEESDRQKDLTELAVPAPLDRRATRRDDLERHLSAAREHPEELRRRQHGLSYGSRPRPGEEELERRPSGRQQGDQDLSEVAVPDPVDRTYRTRDSLEGRLSASPASSRRRRKSRSSTLGRHKLTEDVVPPPEDASPSDRTGGPAEDEEKIPEEEVPSERYSTRLLNEAYTVSWLIFFSLLGTLARLGIEAITKYPNAPISSPVLWANLGGSLILGFLTQDRRIFREEWGQFDSESYSFSPTHDDSESQLGRAYANHTKVKKTIPLFIGLATGFCGSFTSFSSFMRDAFLALTNDLPNPPPGYTIQSPSPTSLHPRSGGYSFMAVAAILIIHPAVSLSAYRTGAHLAIALDPITPVLPFAFIHRILDPAALLLGTGSWIGAVLLTVLPPSHHYDWRPRATFSLIFAPPGCLLRFYASKYLNARVPSFPLGTFFVNILGTAVSGMCYDLQHVAAIAGDGVGGQTGTTTMTYLACSVLEGVMEGFCGCATTVSTWVAELGALERRHAWRYGVASLAVGLGMLVVIMGSVGWTRGFDAAACVS